MIQVNWYGFDHKKVSETLGSEVEFCNSFCVNGEYRPVAVYKAKNPDRSKGHKDYVLLTDKFIRGMDQDEIDKFRYQQGIVCLKCGDAMFSVNRHDFKYCQCGSCAVDGGREYLKILGFPSDYKTIDIDLLELTIL